MVRFGLHIDPPLGYIAPRLQTRGLATFQTTLRDPMRLSKEGVPDQEDQAAYHALAPTIPALWGIAHASLLTNLASPDPRIRNASASTLAADANLAAALGMQGVCFHLGYQKGHTSREAALDAVVYKLGSVLTRLDPGARVLLENSCEGTELGQTVEEIGQVIRAVGGDAAKLGFVLDTCHLHVAGFDLAAPDAPERLADAIAAAGMTSHLTALHLNDAREPCGSHRDRHAIPGEGTINMGLHRLLTHPLFASLPAILELSIFDAEQGIAFLSA